MLAPEGEYHGALPRGKHAENGRGETLNHWAETTLKVPLDLPWQKKLDYKKMFW